MAPSAADIAAALGGARKSGDSWMARCPAHNDRNPSLTLTERNGRLLVHCFAGCEQSAVIAALKERALWPEAERSATCNAAGAGKWRPEWGPYFSGKTVFIVPDNDEPGWQHARLVAASLREHARLVAILPLPFGKDASDYFAMGGSEVWICETVERLLTGAEGGRHAA
jgi:DNA primase